MALPADQPRFHIVHRRLEDCDWEFTREQVASFCLARRMRSRWRTPVIKDAPVELRPRPVHGRGVFATRDIAAGEPATVYPCHDLLWRPESGLNWSVAEPDAFWQAVWRFFDVPGDGEPSPALADASMPGAV